VPQGTVYDSGDFCDKSRGRKLEYRQGIKLRVLGDPDGPQQRSLPYTLDWKAYVGLGVLSYTRRSGEKRKATCASRRDLLD
jgi:hypothetical protein